MKIRNKGFWAVLLAAVMVVSGCSGKAESTYTFPEDYQRISAPQEVTIENSSEQGNSGEVKLESGDIYAVISIKDYGDIKVKLYPDEAPYAVQNFIELANKGTYNGRNFHRVISGFMAQGGSENGDGTGGTSAEGGSFKNEINTSLRHYYGAFCYASAMGNMSDQFYIVNNKENIENIVELYNQYAEYYEYNKQQYESLKEAYADDAAALAQIETIVDFYGKSAEGAKAMADTCTDAVIEKYKNGGTPSLDGGYTVFGQTVEGFEVLDAISSVETEEGSDGAQSKPVKDIIISSVTIHQA
ncbi:MAG: peptidylprolyl isomerase [Ruminiclostridium sp.]